MGTDLKFDTEVFQAAIQEYETIAQGMNELKEKLQSELEELKNTSWDSDAGAQFQSMYEHTWRENVDTYTQFLSHLSEALEAVKGDYSDLCDKTRAIKMS